MRASSWRFPRTSDLGEASNHHATAVVIGDRAILIRGASGSGKTTLAMTLVSWARSSGRFAALVSDDQVLLAAHSGRLVCAPPPAIAGLVEVRGRVPTAISHEASAVLGLVLDLVEPGLAPRFDEDRATVIEGCDLPLIVLPRCNVQAALAPLASMLRLPPFDHTPAQTA